MKVAQCHQACLMHGEHSATGAAIIMFFFLLITQFLHCQRPEALGPTQRIKVEVQIQGFQLPELGSSLSPAPFRFKS